MKFSCHRKNLIEPLAQIVNIIEKRQTMPILGNMLISVNTEKMTITGSDMEIEGVFQCTVNCQEPGIMTIPARKLYDICRLLPDDSEIHMEHVDQHAIVRSGRSRFKLNTLPASDYPAFSRSEPNFQMSMTADKLLRLLEKPSFSIAQQDVRTYLTGLLLEIETDQIRTVGSDGHRLTLCEDQLSQSTESRHSYLIPRKGVTEFTKLLKDLNDTEISIEASSSFLTVRCSFATLSVKLIDENYPIYQSVIPNDSDLSESVTVDTVKFKQVLERVGIMANDRFGKVDMEFTESGLLVNSNSSDKEEAEDVIDIELDGSAFSIAFKCSYLIELTNQVRSESMVLSFPNNKSCVVARDCDDDQIQFVLSPIRV
ncbi:MAG: DNA polymerase III subunit beta [Gammaproteobacteria bacterium]|nr:DNA polymerase III subunit beta [Gammaproteobacteria bacterium]